MMQGHTNSGTYTLHPINASSPLDVYCDMETDGGGWTVLLKRQDGSVDFYLNWTDYKNGFGNLEGEHWLGLDNIHLLTHQSSDPPQLRVDLADWESMTLQSMTSSQLVMRTVTTLSLCQGTRMPVQLETHSHHTTMDRGSAHLTETMIWLYTTFADGHCAVFFHGPWWHRDCYHSLLTGKYFTSGGTRSSPPYGIIWSSWKGFEYSLRYADMKIRPRGV